MQPGYTYHIYNHGNGDDNIFRSDENYRYFLQKFVEHTTAVAICYAYCLLPNHFHFLIGIKAEDQLSNLSGFRNLTGLDLNEKIIKQFSNFFNGYSKAFNKMYDRKGKLFRLPFQRKRVSNSWQFLNTWKYIHYNPVHHGFAKDIDDWPHSSVHDYRLMKVDPIACLEAQIKAESKLTYTNTRDFKPDWNDFLDLNY